MKKSSKIYLIVISSVLGAVAFATLKHAIELRCHDLYPLIREYATCDSQGIKPILSFESKQKIVSTIESMIKENKVDNISLYYRELHSGFFWGVNEFEEFVPASLLKLPIAITFLSSAIDQPELLETSIFYKGNDTFDKKQGTLPKVTIKAGEAYKIEDILKYMIVYSDNNSYELLESFISSKPERIRLKEEVLQELGFIDPKSGDDKTLTVRGYSSLFRILFNASYLDSAHSQKLLQWLAESDYKDGLVAGVPSDITVAHKFGERLLSDSKQLHDCGIIYYPDNPYVLCIMTVGDNWDNLSQVIKEISALTYEEVSKRK